MQGFYAIRCVFAHTSRQGLEKAFANVRQGLGHWNADIRDGLASVHLNAEEVELTAWWNAFRRFNRVHPFYADD